MGGGLCDYRESSLALAKSLTTSRSYCSFYVFGGLLDIGSFHSVVVD